MDDQPCQVPLIERLRSVPKTAREMVEINPTEHRNIPYGALCHEAADALEDRSAATIHSCSNECQRPLCVMRRDLVALLTIVEIHLTDEERFDTPDWPQTAQRKTVNEIKARRKL